MTRHPLSRPLSLAALVAVGWLGALASPAFAKVCPDEPLVLPPTPAAAAVAPEPTSLAPYILIAVVAVLVTLGATLAVQALVRHGHVATPTHA